MKIFNQLKRKNLLKLILRYVNKIKIKHKFNNSKLISKILFLIIKK
jgi:hypothetical protein